MRRFIRRGVCTLLTLGALSATGSVFAGVPECGNLRLEEAVACELRASVDCEASCSDLGVFKKTCATQLTEQCRRTQCQFKATATCQDPCTDTCKQACDRGADITCQHNCFTECKGACETQCEGASDPAQCFASCEATCDGECDAKCVGVDGDCYYHCTECCHGSCSAEANLDCQVECQQVEFERCEYESQAQCDASCSAEGSLFCDGEFVLSGAANLARCAEALATRGLLTADVAAKIKLQSDIDLDLDSVTDGGERGADAAGVGCAVAERGASSGTSVGWWLALAVLFGRRKRR